jgi:glycosyltransferase involved in cell wall biosynthesis
MKKTKIAIIAHGCRAGGGLFATLNLIRSMFGAARDEQYLLICSKGYGYEDLPLPVGCQIYVYDGSHAPHKRFYFEKITLPKIIANYKPDVIFGPGNIALSSSRIPQAVLIHTAYLYHGPDRYPEATLKFKLRTWSLRRQVKKALPSTQMIFAQIPVVKERFCHYWNYPPDQVKIIRFPSPSEIQPDPDCPVPRPLLAHKECFKVLMMTRYMPHRNPGILIPLCLKYMDIFREHNIRFITTVDPGEKPLGSAFLEKIKKHHLQDLIINVGQLNRQEVVQYFTHCDVLWLHTLIETLCLPFLEAMTLKLSIMAPDFDFSRYVCGDAALYYDPWDLESAFQSIMKLKKQPDLREQLIREGENELKKSDKFSANWQEVASDVLKYLRELANQ